MTSRRWNVNIRKVTPCKAHACRSGNEIFCVDAFMEYSLQKQSLVSCLHDLLLLWDRSKIFYTSINAPTSCFQWVKRKWPEMNRIKRLTVSQGQEKNEDTYNLHSLYIIVNLVGHLSKISVYYGDYFNNSDRLTGRGFL